MALAAQALELPPTFIDGMVLQQGVPIPVAGTTTAGQTVTVQLGEGPAAETLAGPDGAFALTLPARAASDAPTTLTVSADETHTVGEVWIGEVWLCAGQSNMQMILDHTIDRHLVRQATPMPRLRLLDLGADEPRWEPATLAHVGDWSAVCSFLGQELHERLDVPVGLISASMTNSSIEAWTPSQAVPEGLRYTMAEAALQRRPGALYERFIAPITRVPVRAIAWYQGETNAGFALKYPELLQTLLTSWRAAWKQPLEFALVQLPSHQTNPRRAHAGHWAEIRDAQASVATADAGAELIVTLDMEDVERLHPRDKRRIGLRIARWSLATHHGQPGAWRGPQVMEAVREGGQLLLHLSGPVSGTGGGFQLAEHTEGPFVDTSAQIEGSTIRIDLLGLPGAKVLRYAWMDDASEVLLRGEHGLVVAPFRLDIH